MRVQPVSHVGMFTYWHNNAPAPFNPLYQPAAKNWSLIATYRTYLDGAYDAQQRGEITREQTASIRDAHYENLKANGFSQDELKKAQEWSKNI